MNILTHLLCRIPREHLPRPEAELPKWQERGNYKEADYPFTSSSELLRV